MELEQLVLYAKKLAKHVEGDEAFEEEVDQILNLSTDEVELDLNQITNVLTFDNTHEVAYILCTGEKQDVAKALHAELSYWVDRI